MVTREVSATANLLHVEIVKIDVPTEFRSSKDEVFFARITSVNKIEQPAQIQVVFKGYIRDDSSIIYEFLHEQCYIALDKQGQSVDEVKLEVRIRRLPPTMKLADKLFVEYCCQVNATAWYTSNHSLAIFRVVRDDGLIHHGQPLNRFHVNECVGHNQCCHRKCRTLNGQFWMDKNICAPGDKVKVLWKAPPDTEFEEAEVKLFQIITLRRPNADHPMDLDYIRKDVASRSERIRADTPGIILQLPKDLPAEFKSTIWNTVKLNYVINFSLKFTKIRKPVKLEFPLTVQQFVSDKNNIVNNVFTEIGYDFHQMDSQPKSWLVIQPHNITVSKLELMPGSKFSLEGAKILVEMHINQEQYYTIHFLFQGSVKIGGQWYEFLRYKTTISKETLKIGPFQTVVDIPFDQNEYLTGILPPSFNDEIRYECLLTTQNWADNRILARKIVLVDRETETLSKAEMLRPYYEEQGAIKIYMIQRAYTRGKYVRVQVEGKVSAVNIALVQHKRIRRPGLKNEGCWLKERIVCEIESSPNRRDWPKEWSLRIPSRIAPSIDMCYWNVLAIDYKIAIRLHSHDKHAHVHIIPIWIGTTDDELALPSGELLEISENDEQQGEISRNHTKIAPDFEVIPNEGDQPWWVDRLDFDVYHPVVNEQTTRK